MFFSGAVLLGSGLAQLLDVWRLPPWGMDRLAADLILALIYCLVWRLVLAHKWLRPEITCISDDID